MENDFERFAPGGEPGSPTQAHARAAFEELSRDGAILAARIVTPWWYHSVLGVITAIFAGAHALPGAWPLIAMALGIIAIPVLTATYTRRYGVVVTKPAGPRGKRLLLSMLTVTVAAMVSSLSIKFMGLDPGWALGPALITFVATVVLGRRYDEVLRQEIAALAGARS